MRALAQQLWKLQCRLNRRLPGSPSGDCPIRFLPRGGSIDVLGSAARVSADLCFVIMTHARAEPCRALVESLHAGLVAEGSSRAFALVLRDTSDDDYGGVERALASAFPNAHALYESSAWLGKPNRYHAYQVAFDAVRKLNPEKTIFLEDDAAIVPSFVADATSFFDAIDDTKKAVLYLCSFPDDEPEGRWVHYARHPISSAPVNRTQWFDLHAFITNRHFFESLHWELFQPYASRWDGRPWLSSGVSEQFTRRLRGRGNVYQVRETLAYHGKLPSILNVQARQARSLDNFPKARET